MKQLLYRSIYCLFYLLSLLPMPFLYALSSFAFLMTYHVFDYRKTIVVQNIARSFPNMQYGELQCVVKQFYTSFTRYFAEMIKSLSAPAAVLDRKMEFDNLEVLEQYVKAGQNVIACMGHCGNWEMLHFMPYRLRRDVYAVYKPLRSPVMNKLMIRLRSRFGMRLIPDQSVVRRLLTHDPHRRYTCSWPISARRSKMKNTGSLSYTSTPTCFRAWKSWPASAARPLCTCILRSCRKAGIK